MDIKIRRSHIVVASVVVILIASSVIYFLTRPKPQPWLDYPTDGQALVTQFMGYIRQDTNPAFNQAYKLVNLPDRKPDDDGHLQVYHNINMYMSSLFGETWGDHMTIVASEPGKTYEVHVAKEVLHIDVVPQGPPNGPLTDHLGIADIREFSLDDSAKATQMQGITSIIGGVAGRGAQRNLAGVIVAGGSYARMNAMQRKQTIFPVILDPNNIDGRRSMLHLYPIRNDPTVIDVLTQIKDDQRYARDMQDTAKQILAGTVDNETLISIGE